MDQGRQQEIIVIGAGLGGLASAALLARGGARVRVLDSAQHAGGRARSRVQEGFTFNVGAHALYRGGPATRVLRELGVPIAGRPVGKTGTYALLADQLYALPYTARSLLTSEILSVSGKLSFMRVLASLTERTARAVQGQTVNQWLERAAPDLRVRALLRMLVRLGCYAHAPDLLGADAAVRQLAHGLRHNVMYLDGGWQTLLDALLAQTRAAGVTLELGLGARQIELHAGRITAVHTSDGRRLPAADVVAAVDPQTLSALLPEDATASRWAQAAVPLRAACMDLGVRELPQPQLLNVQALDAPLYFANHSAYAKLAPEGAHLISLVRYLAPGEDGPATEPELRAFLERIQPGVWERAVVKRFMPNLIVHNDLPGPERARSVHPHILGLHLVSDASSQRFMLADAVLESASAAAARILQASPRTAASAPASTTADHAA